MRLLEDVVADPETLGSVLNGVKVNGTTARLTQDSSDEEEEEEEPEPVSATLVLRVVSDAASPSLSRKSSFRRNQPPGFLVHDDNNGDTFLQVQVQRSTSSSSISGRPPSRPASATPSFYVTEPERDWSNSRDEFGYRDSGRHVALTRDNSRDFGRLSRDTSRESSVSPTPSMYGSMDLYNQKLSPVEMINKVGQHTRAMENGLRELRKELDEPTKLLDIGQETVVLSGLNKQAGDSLKHIKNLYDETKYLKTYLEKLEAKVHYDMVMRKSRPDRPPWYRRVLFVAALGGAVVFAWYKVDPQGCEGKLRLGGEKCLSMFETAKLYFATNYHTSNAVLIE